MKRILLTGGLGYIGSNLVDYLKEMDYGCEITIVDKKDDYHVLDIEDAWRYDGIIHLAAIAGILECKNDPEEAITTNITSTLYIMQEACKYNKPLVFASSGAASTPYESLYGMSKWIGEAEAKRLNREGGENHILRFSNVYGGGYWRDKPSVIPLFINAKDKNKKLIINGNGSQRRDFIHVEDVCKAIWLALNSKRVTSLPIPICTGKTISILEVATMIAGKNGFTFNKESDIIGVENVETDTKLARDVYGFQAKENIEDHLVIDNGTNG